MSGADLDPRLAGALARIAPVEPGLTGNWEDVVARVLARGGRQAVPGLLRRGRPRLRVAVAVALVLLLAGVATATYLAVRSSGGRSVTGGLSLIVSGGASLHAKEQVAVVGPGGRLRVVWQCPQPTYCGHLVSMAWSRDGRRLALGFDLLAAPTTYLGLHVVDVATGSDLHVPPVASTAPPRAVVAAARKALGGCLAPYDLAWSADGSHLAYICAREPLSPPGRLFVIRADGTGARRLPAGGANAASPTWSPDGRIAFVRDGGIWVASADGRRVQHVASEASAPSWSPDGRTIAYWSTGRCRGVRLVRPDGRDVTPRARGFRCGAFPKAGRPVWSPDGSQLAIGTEDGVFVMHADGSQPERVTRQSGGGVFATGRPSWSQGPHPHLRKEQSHAPPPPCNGCY